MKSRPSPRPSLTEPPPTSPPLTTDELLAQAAVLRDRMIDNAAQLATFTRSLRDAIDAGDWSTE